MPTKGWAGLTASDNSQAKAIAAVMKKFTDEGIEVWLRFGRSTRLQVFLRNGADEPYSVSSRSQVSRPRNRLRTFRLGEAALRRVNRPPILLRQLVRHRWHISGRRVGLQGGLGSSGEGRC